VKIADWVVDLGPGAGTAGGRVDFEGTPSELATHQDSLTDATSPKNGTDLVEGPRRG
jgi:excinuclease UvrABC ATPase subunit